MSAIRQVVSSGVTRNLVRSYHAPANFRRPTMNDLPIPNGKWQTHYDAKNAKYNRHLLLGVGFTVFTLAVAKASGLIYLNYSPPSLD